MKALVIGGTGPSGPFVLRGLLDRGSAEDYSIYLDNPLELGGETEQRLNDP